MENRRTETARDNDDSDIIDNIEPTPPQGGSSGGISLWSGAPVAWA